MKKMIALGLSACLLFNGCIRENTNSESGEVGDEQESAASTDKGQVNTQASITEDDTRLAYYQQLVASLQQEVLNLKTEIYTERVSYEARIAELEDQLSQSVVSPTPIDTLFSYTVTNGAATVVGYNGSASDVTVPETLGGYPVRYIGDRAFMNLERLKSVTLPQGIESIGWFAFSGCVAMTSVHIPRSVESISYGAFLNCNATMTVFCVSGSYAEQYARSYGIRTSAT